MQTIEIILNKKTNSPDKLLKVKHENLKSQNIE